MNIINCIIWCITIILSITGLCLLRQKKTKAIECVKTILWSVITLGVAKGFYLIIATQPIENEFSIFFFGCLLFFAALVVISMIISYKINNQEDTKIKKLKPLFICAIFGIAAITIFVYTQFHRFEVSNEYFESELEYELTEINEAPQVKKYELTVFGKTKTNISEYTINIGLYDKDLNLIESKSERVKKLYFFDWGIEHTIEISENAAKKLKYIRVNFKGISYEKPKEKISQKEIKEQFELPIYYKITYIVDSNKYGTGIASNYKSIRQPEKMKKEGYTFMGWYTDPLYINKYDIKSPITRDITLYGKFVKN